MLFEEITLGELKPLKRAFNRRQPTPENQSGEPAAATACCCHPLLFAASLAVQAVVGAGRGAGKIDGTEEKEKKEKKKETDGDQEERRQDDAGEDGKKTT